MEDYVGVVAVCGELGVHTCGVCIIDNCKKRHTEVGA